MKAFSLIQFIVPVKLNAHKSWIGLRMSDSNIYLVSSEAVNFILIIFSVTMEYDQIVSKTSRPAINVTCIIVKSAVFLILTRGPGCGANQRPVSRSRDHSRPIRGQYPGHVITQGPGQQITKQNVYHC